MPKIGSITYQFTKALEEKLSLGTKRREAKKDGTADQIIVSGGTMQTYLKQSIRFGKWAQNEYGCKTKEDCRQYAGEYLRQAQERGDSAASVKTYASALAKVYGCHINDFGVKLEERRRADITRSRNKAAMDRDKHTPKTEQIIEVCKGIGFRRHEAARARGTDLIEKENGSYYVRIKGKGGKVRESYILPDRAAYIVPIFKAAGKEKLFDRVSCKIDVHGYRGEYAAALYRSLAREEIPREEQYRCRKDKAGTTYDKAAMQIVSHNLGHGRISVIAGNYLY